MKLNQYQKLILVAAALLIGLFLSIEVSYKGIEDARWSLPVISIFLILFTLAKDWDFSSQKFFEICRRSKNLISLHRRKIAIFATIIIVAIFFEYILFAVAHCAGYYSNLYSIAWLSLLVIFWFSDKVKNQFAKRTLSISLLIFFVWLVFKVFVAVAGHTYSIANINNFAIYNGLIGAFIAIAISAAVCFVDNKKIKIFIAAVCILLLPCTDGIIDKFFIQNRNLNVYISNADLRIKPLRKFFDKINGRDAEVSDFIGKIETAKIYLPLKIDEYVTLTKISEKNKEITYTYEVDPKGVDLVASKQFHHLIFGRICTDKLLFSINSKGYEFVYNYFIKNEIVAQVKVSANKCSDYVE